MIWIVLPREVRRSPCRSRAKPTCPFGTVRVIGNYPRACVGFLYVHLRVDLANIQEAHVPCTGRDAMCNSVLNDEWVSHPSWSSEDSGFVAHKKNAYEEALHRSEEERHEYDFYIEAMMKTITVLEPIHSKINQLSEAERTTFKLKPNWNGQLKSIHQRLLKKIYGREAGLEVVQALQDSPVLAFPVVIQRLKQKEEEWKRAQREWNKVWREVDARNFWKSLDHQGVTFKTNDKKAITTKAFVNHIELAREEQLAKRASLIDPSFARTRPRYQLAYGIEDVSVLQDALKLVLSFLDRTQGQISAHERKKIENFLRHFIPLFFMFYHREFDSAFQLHSDSADSDIIMSDGMASVLEDDPSSVAGSTRSRNGKKSGAGPDIRKRLLKATQQERPANRKARSVASTTGSIAPSPPPSSNNSMDVDVAANSNGANGDSSLANGTKGTAVRRPKPVDKSYKPPSGSSRKYSSQRGTFFANSTLYVLLRLLQVSVMLASPRLSWLSAICDSFFTLVCYCARISPPSSSPTSHRPRRPIVWPQSWAFRQCQMGHLYPTMSRLQPNFFIVTCLSLWRDFSIMLSTR